MNYRLNTLIAATLFGASLPVTAYDGERTSERNRGDSREISNCASGDGSRRSESLSVVGLTTDNRLVCFNEREPGNARNIGEVSNLSGDVKLIGIDFRVQNGKLYGVGNAGGIYTLDTTNAIATKVSQLSVALAGTSFGVDFNPPADRLRIVSDTGQNLRHNVNPTGVGAGITVVDDPLDYPVPTTLNSIGPTALGIGAAAYTNNDLNPLTGTTLYVIDTMLDQVAIQSPPNDGTLALTGRLTVDGVKVLDIEASAGFDIYSTIRNDATVAVQALGVFKPKDGAYGLYSVSLPTGRVSPRGEFGAQIQVIDIAVPLRQL